MTKLHDAFFQLLGSTLGVVKASILPGERFDRGGDDFPIRPSLSVAIETNQLP
jgi:hypothetical protein